MSFRSRFCQFVFCLFVSIILFLGMFQIVLGQVYPGYTPPNQTAPNQTAPNQTAPNQTAPNQTPLLQTAPSQTPPIRMQPLQTPPKAIYHNGVDVHNGGTSNLSGSNQPRTGGERTMPQGFGSPFPTGLQPDLMRTESVKIASSGNADPSRKSDISAVDPLPQTASTMPAVSRNYQPTIVSPNSADLQQNQMGTNGGNLGVVNLTGSQNGGIPVAGNSNGQPQQNYTYVGRSAPPTRLMPYLLTPDEQKELDDYLARWEKYSEKINRFDVDFELWVYDETIPGAEAGKPQKRPFGYFKYIAPTRFVYHVEGEWVNGVKQKRDDRTNQQIIEEKIIIDDKAVYLFDYNAQTVRQINVPPELIGRGIADSPLPLIFGAKSSDMKRRFSMKIVTGDQYKETQIWLQARPLLIEDQQEFLQIEMRLDKKTLRAIALKKDNINGKSHDVYVFDNQKINDRLVSMLDDVRTFFTPAVPRGWTHDIVQHESPAAAPSHSAGPVASQSPPSAALTTPPQSPQQFQQPRHEIELYSPK
ncbi:MAG: hypothetical protein ACRCUY_06280 [Thermoguttaceae bacterium]